MASLECEHDSEGCTGKGKLSPPHTHTPCPRVLAGSGRVQGLEPWTSWPQLMLQLDPSSCSSVDGRVRRYDLRLGQLFSDYVGSKCGGTLGQAGPVRGSKGGPSLTHLCPSPPPRPHHLYVL